MANSGSNSTMAKLLLQSKPPQSQLAALSTSSAGLRLVAKPQHSTAGVATTSSAAASTLILTPHQEVTVVPVMQIQTMASTTSSNSVVPQISNHQQLQQQQQQPVMIRFSEQQLADMSLKELNHYLRGLTKEEAADVKRMRRAAKNKSYAVVQREKRQDDVQRLSARKAGLNDEISAEKFRKTRMTEELNKARKESSALMALAKRLKVQVPPHVYELRSQSAAANSDNC